MTIEQGTRKQTRVKRQVALGTIATTADGQIIRRKTSSFELAKETTTTEDEMTSTQQVRSLRHGVRMVNGTIDGLLSPGTYADMISAVMRRDFAVVPAIVGVSITVAAGAIPGTFTLSRGTGSWLTGGIKVGMVVRMSAAGNAANQNKNLLVLAVTALQLTVAVLDGVALAVEGPIAGVTVTPPGRVTHVPDAGHTNIYHTVEEWYPTVPYSERNTDVKFHKADFALPGTGNATIKLDAIGLNQTEGAIAYFTAPVAESATEVVNASGGYLMVDGVPMAIVTDLSISVDGKGAAADGVVGSNVRPDVFTGKVSVTGSLTAYFDSAALATLFKNEQAVVIVGALMAGAAANADFIAYAMSNVKLTSNTPDDQPTGLKRTYSFQSIYNAAGGADRAHPASSLQLHDSAAS